jgi:hypothetical protein
MEAAASRVIDACLLLLLVTLPLFTRGAGREMAIILVGVAAGGAFALYQKGSRAQRQSRRGWVVFLAIAAGIHLAASGAAPGAGADGISTAAARVARLGAAGALLAWVFRLAVSRRLPPLSDAYDWASVIAVGIFALSAAAFASVGDARSGLVLAPSAAIAAMLLIARERCMNLARGRMLALVATVCTVAGVAVWGLAG